MPEGIRIPYTIVSLHILGSYDLETVLAMPSGVRNILRYFEPSSKGQHDLFLIIDHVSNIRHGKPGSTFCITYFLRLLLTSENPQFGSVRTDSILFFYG